jgi:hypothetical protein
LTREKVHKSLLIIMKGARTDEIREEKKS